MAEALGRILRSKMIFASCNASSAAEYSPAASALVPCCRNWEKTCFARASSSTAAAVVGLGVAGGWARRFAREPAVNAAAANTATHTRFDRLVIDPSTLARPLLRRRRLLVVAKPCNVNVVCVGMTGTRPLKRPRRRRRSGYGAGVLAT